MQTTYNNKLMYIADKKTMSSTFARGEFACSSYQVSVRFPLKKTYTIDKIKKNSYLMGLWNVNFENSR